MKRMGLITFMIFEVSILFGCGASMDSKAEEMEVQVPNDLPNMIISLLDGSQMNAKKLEGKTVLILFFPDCDHCQREAAQIQKHITSFKGHTLYFLTTAAKQEAEKFAVDYKLNNIKNVKFGFVTVNDVLTNFGAVATPSLYIYSSDHKLVQKFNGETNIDSILKYVK
jgi:peroxiredoxin